jgi:hypothetical protein
MDQDMGPEEQKEHETEGEQPAPRTIGRQITGALIGGVVVWVLVSWARQAGWMGGDPVRYALWGAVVGGLIGALENLDVAGGRLTRRDNVWLNTAVAIGGMVVVSVMLYGLSRAAAWVVQQVMER